MFRTALVLGLFTSAALAQGDKAAWEFDARLTALDRQLAGFAKLGFDAKTPAPEGDAAAVRQRTVDATALLTQVRIGLAELQAAGQAELDAKAAARNADVRRFRAANREAGSHLIFLDRVAAQPSKAGFEAARAGYAAEWDSTYGASAKRPADLDAAIAAALKPYLADAEKAGYARSAGNPYTGDYYARFYDDAGAVKAAVWTAAVEGWKRYQADSKETTTRLRDRGAEIEKKAQDLDAALTAYEVKLKTLDAAVGPAADKLNQAELVGTWKGETVQGANKVGVTLTIEADGKIANTAANGQSGQGMWIRAGDKLMVRWSTGAEVTWTIKDGKITGGGTTPRGDKWSIEFAKQ